MATTTHPKYPYIRVFLGLAALTAVEVGVAGLALNPTLRVVGLLSLAIIKALLVALFYMHLRYDHRLLSIVGGIPFVLAIFMLILLLLDRMMVM